MAATGALVNKKEVWMGTVAMKVVLIKNVTSSGRSSYYT